MVNSSKVSLCPKLPQNKFCQWVFLGKVDGFFRIHIILPFPGLGFSLYFCVNGNPLQSSCLKNLKDRGAWWASPWVAESGTQHSTHAHWNSTVFPTAGKKPVLFLKTIVWAEEAQVLPGATIAAPSNYNVPNRCGGHCPKHQVYCAVLTF